MQIQERNILDDIILRVHKTAEDIMEAFWSFGPEAVTREDLKQAEMGGMTSEGQRIEITWDDQLQGMKETGLWGFYNNNTLTIHIWISEDTKPEEALFVIGHELGEAWNCRPIQVEIGDMTEEETDQFLDEMHADRYGAVAVRAQELLQQLFSNKV